MNTKSILLFTLFTLILVVCINEPRLFKFAALGFALGIGLRLIVDGGKKDKDKSKGG